MIQWVVRFGVGQSSKLRMVSLIATEDLSQVALCHSSLRRQNSFWYHNVNPSTNYVNFYLV